ncbi:MAG TPA: hypothetical protein VGA20_02390 [Gemmatimonadales bacterium]
MNWLVAGLIGGVAAWLADYVLWSKVFTKGMEAFATPPPPGQPVNMGPMMVKSAALALLYGIAFAFVYQRFMGNLWTSAGLLGGMELATVLWLPIAFANLGSNVWYDKARPLLSAQMWAWLIRMNVAGAVVGLFVKTM